MDFLLVEPAIYDRPVNIVQPRGTYWDWDWYEACRHPNRACHQKRRENAAASKPTRFPPPRFSVPLRSL